MRLDKYLADMSVGSRSIVKKIIQKGQIKVNDKIVKNSDYKLNENDLVYYNDQLIEYVKYEYYLLNKPSGYLCAISDKKDKVVIDLIESKRKDLVPIGRLDKDTEGLLLISNDGKLNHDLCSPKNHIEKKYYVEVDNVLPINAKEIFSKEMDLGDFIAKPSIYENINDRSCYLTIYEGKFHQVKRMFEKINCKVTYLKRVKYKNIELNDLKIGEYRHLTSEEIADLKNINQNID